MQVGIIAPPKLLKYCEGFRIQYCLPKLIIENEQYRKYFRKRWELGNIVVMDCRTPNWKREPEDFFIVSQALTFLAPTHLIYPSYMYNLPRTLKALSEFRARFGEGVPCVEGADKGEIRRCLELLRGYDTIAYPHYLYRLCPPPIKGKKVIYLDNHRSVEEIVGDDGSMLITSLPIRLGLQGRLLSDPTPTPPSLTFFEDKDEFSMVTKTNVEEVLRIHGM